MSKKAPKSYRLPSDSAASVAETTPYWRTRLAFSTVSLPRKMEKVMCRSFSQIFALCLIVITSPLFCYRAWQAKRLTGRIFKRQTRIGYKQHRFEILVFNSAGFGENVPLLFNVLRNEMRFTGVRALSPEEAAELIRIRDMIHFHAYPGIFTTYALHQRLGIDYKTELETEYEYIRTETLGKNISLILRSVFSLIFNPAPAHIAHPTVDIFGITLTNTTLAEALDEILQHAQSAQKLTFSFVNADCLNIAYYHRQYRRALDQAQRVFADGSGIRLACRLLGEKLRGNVNGTDLFPQLCARLAETNLSIYLLGAQPDVAKTTAVIMRQRYPGLKIAGTDHGYFKPTETAAVLQRINQSGASILLVAMGAPRQELWLAAHREQLAPAVCLGVGGLFDFYSGRIPRAPLWMREIGLEWVWRLLQEPTRMWKRYIIGNPLFLYRVFKQARQQQAAQHMSTYYKKPYLRALRYLSLDLNLRWNIQKIRTSLSLKRCFDVICASIALVCLSPFLMLTAIWIRLDSKGDILFSQTRVGKNGVHFPMWKFRSMYSNAEERKTALLKHNEMNGGVIFKIKNDPRITPVGKFIRKFSIDEMPQLWNVLLGDMSLVGPRPPVPSEVAQYSPHDLQRLRVTPGLTCTWQVSGRSEIPFPQQVEMDLEYIAKQSFWYDMVLLAKTIPAVLKARGAY